MVGSPINLVVDTARQSWANPPSAQAAAEQTGGMFAVEPRCCHETRPGSGRAPCDCFAHAPDRREVSRITQHGSGEAIALNRSLAAARLEVVEAAVSGKDGTTHFATGYEHQWDGQTITEPGTDFSPWGFGDTKMMTVRSVSLKTLTREIPIIDLVDMDVQGAEADIVETFTAVLSERVRWLHIETHSTDQETRIRQTLMRLGFHKVWDYPCYQDSIRRSGAGVLQRRVCAADELRSCEARESLL